MERLQYIQTMRGAGKELGDYIDQDGQRLATFGPISRVNILVGATNSGKSRFMRALAKMPDYVGFSLDPSIAHPNSVLNTCTRLSRTEFHILIQVKSTPRESDIEEFSLALTQTEGKFFWTESWKEQVKQYLGRRESEIHLIQRDFPKIKALLEQELTKPGGSTASKQREETLDRYVQDYRFALRASECRDQIITVPGIAKLRWSKEGLTKDIIESIEAVLDFIEASSPFDSHSLIPQKVIYIPVLRTTVPLKEVSTSSTMDCLAQSIGTNYELDSTNARVEVFTGNLLYWTIQEERSGDPQIHKRLKDFERFLGKTFFEGASVELVPLIEQYDPGRHLALFIDEQIQRRLHDLGDGIQAIIILMYKLFTAERGTWIFIEEPEQGLHPGLQRIFLETLARHPVLRDKDFTVFMSTHSNHLLGMAISELDDVSVFVFQRWTDPERFEIRPVHTRQQNLLTLLGVVNSSVFLANCGIWVEGITDRKYLRAYLSAYLQSDEFKTKHTFVPQEDVHYAFFEYAGSNLAHYLFEFEDDASSDQSEQICAQFLCNRIFLLADQDESKEEKHKRLEACQSDSFRYFVTPGIEVENLISEAELSQALPQLISGLIENEVLRAEIRFSDYREKRIGFYLKETFGDRCPDALKAASGTLSAYYKDKLASLVCPNVTWENMSKDAHDLAKALYEFIYRHNQVAPKPA